MPRNDKFTVIDKPKRQAELHRRVPDGEPERYEWAGL
jgi:hypothetical protein